MDLTPQKLIERYREGERNFAGHNIIPPEGESKTLCRVFENVDLRGINLSGSDLSDFTMRGCDLSGSILNGTNFFECCLEKVNLFGTSMVGANLSRASLAESDLTGSDMSHAVLGRNGLNGTNTTNATLYRSVIYKCDFSRVVIDKSARGVWIGDAFIWKITTPNGTFIEGPLLFQEDWCGL